MDFYTIREHMNRNGTIEIYPDFKICRSTDLMVRGGKFYAIWDAEASLWSTDEYDVARLVDADLYKYKENMGERGARGLKIQTMSTFTSSPSWLKFQHYIRNISDSSKQLDEKLTFNNTKVKKKDYVSKRLLYDLAEGECPAYEELISTLYKPTEREKLEWAIGSIVVGDAKDIQKFIVLYGEAGAGKSTILNIIQQLFAGYYTTFEAKALTSSSNAFSTEVFKSNPLVAIQHDGDLSKIEDNTKLNSIVSHEQMTMNEKFKSSYMARVNCFLFMGTNKPVKITDAKSGIIRRLIDVQPSGKRLGAAKYQQIMAQIVFELGFIANHCKTVYKKLGKHYYDSYKPVDMMMKTDVFFNFIEFNIPIFLDEGGIPLARAYDLYKNYCVESLIEYKLPMYKFREELKNYFEHFNDRIRIDGKQYRNYYSGFLANKFELSESSNEEPINTIKLTSTKSIFDKDCKDCPAQYANENGTPIKKWKLVTTKLSDIDTTKLHYVKPPLHHIVIDFDLTDKKGNKSIVENLKAASVWPPTYSETSKSGQGLHLHYLYSGDITELSRVFSEGIEIKVFTGDSSLRRQVTKCNDLAIASIHSGLPRKAKKMMNFEAVKSEQALRNLIKRNLRKEIHPGTKPSIDFINKILEDASASGMSYDVSDLKSSLLAFANNSSHQSLYCIKMVSGMKLNTYSENQTQVTEDDPEAPIVFFDVEVFENLLVVAWKYEGEDKQCVRMINPTAQEIEKLINLKLIGFNCRGYDNHILYARYLGYDLKQLYELSQRIINGGRNVTFSEAYNISYADIYDFSSKKQSLKKFEIDLGIKHNELGLPWDEPVPESLWDKVCDYCCDDVIATEATFNSRKEDFVARQILADLSGLKVNDTTQRHVAKIIFGHDRNPQQKFQYTDLSEMFPGYKYDSGKSTYKEEDPGEGGYVYSEPGIHHNVALLDVASMHPTSIELLNLFGTEYTNNFSQLKEARMAIKHNKLNKAKKMLNGALAKYLVDEKEAEDLAYALKIIINSVYGLTAARFDNTFKDIRNIDNIVAKRGALFMIDLKRAVQMKGYTVAHIKTDSIKIPNASNYIIDFIKEFGRKYGYEFEHEATYKKMCLVNDAVYVAKYDGGKHDKEWVAVGAQYAHPYIFKTLFSKEPIEFEDMCEAKAVRTALYLDMNEKLDKDAHDYHFVGKVGLFTPVVKGAGGGVLLRLGNNEKYSAVNNTKGYRWLESEMVKVLEKQEYIDKDYYRKLVDDALTNINKFGDAEFFINS